MYPESEQVPTPERASYFEPICPEPNASDLRDTSLSSPVNVAVPRSPPSRNESVISSSSYARSESSSVGHNPDFPLPPTEGDLANLSRNAETDSPDVFDSHCDIPEDIRRTMDKIKRSSDSAGEESLPDSAPIPPPPEPNTDLLPNSYFQPQLIAKLRLVTDNASSDNASEQESTSSEEQISDVILKHERNILQLTEFKEDLIDVYRKNEEIGEQINQVIKNQCPKSVVSKYHLFVEDIESNFNLLSKLSGRILRAEASMAEQHHDSSTRDALAQKLTALRAQMSDAQKCQAHCDAREKHVQDALKKQLEPDEFVKYTAYVLEKRNVLEERAQIEERIRMVEAQLVQLKESLNK